MRELSTTPKFSKAFRKFARRNAKLQQQIEDTIAQMQADLYDPASEHTTYQENSQG